MKEFFSDIRNDNITQKSFFGSIFIIFLSVVYILFYYSNLPPFIPLYNQLPWGEQRLAATSGILIPSLLGFVIFIFNLILSSIIYKKIPLISRMLSVTTLLIALLTFLFIIRTVQIVL
jgi:hypothetical protein